jgi:hypothetical protein
MENRTRLMVGFALLAIGLFISVGSWNLVLSYPGSSFVFIDYVVPHNRVLFLDSFAVYQVPDYLLRYLMLGVFTTTVGITIVAPSLLKRFTGIEED